MRDRKLTLRKSSTGASKAGRFKTTTTKTTRMSERKHGATKGCLKNYLSYISAAGKAEDSPKGKRKSARRTEALKKTEEST